MTAQELQELDAKLLAAVLEPPFDILAIVLADEVVTDKGSGKMTIIGTYNAIFTPVFPCRHSPFIAYLAVADGRGEMPVRIRIVDAKEARKPVLEGEAVFTFSGDGGVFELVLRQPEVTFPKPGEYRLQICADGRVLRQRRFMVLPIPGRNS